MIAVFAILAPFLLACVVLFIRFQPLSKNKSKINSFNIIVAVLAILVSIAVSIYFWRKTGQSMGRA
jgi:uncharacterized membrane protein YbhN (UPF0104 family)